MTLLELIDELNRIYEQGGDKLVHLAVQDEQIPTGRKDPVILNHVAPFKEFHADSYNRLFLVGR